MLFCKCSNPSNINIVILYMTSIQVTSQQFMKIDI